MCLTLRAYLHTEFISTARKYFNSVYHGKSVKALALVDTITYVVRRSVELKNAHTDETAVPVEFACIFCHSEEEYQEFTHIIQTLGKIVERTQSGYTYLLNEPIITMAGPLRLGKIRKPDSKIVKRGDADFNTDYKSFKKEYEGNPKFELIRRVSFEMLRLSDPEFDAMACFSSIPKSKELGIQF